MKRARDKIAGTPGALAIQSVDLEKLLGRPYSDRRLLKSGWIALKLGRDSCTFRPCGPCEAVASQRAAVREHTGYVVEPGFLFQNDVRMSRSPEIATVDVTADACSRPRGHFRKEEFRHPRVGKRL